MNALPQPSPAPLAGSPRELRPMTVRDLDAVAAIEARAYGFPWSRGNFVDSLAAGYWAWVLEGGRDGVRGRADRADDRVGYLIALPGAGELHLLNVTVAPEHQGRGRGTVMLDALEAAGRERGFDSLWLEVRTSNVRAQALYARRGFVEVGRRRGYYPAAGGREDAILMSLDLRPGARGAVD